MDFLGSKGDGCQDGLAGKLRMCRQDMLDSCPCREFS
jgi:hypothetical protein